jgi:hypothetical protein
MSYLLVLRYHATKRDSCMLVNMVEDSLKHLTTDIVKINIDAIREVPIIFKTDNDGSFTK